MRQHDDPINVLVVDDHPALRAGLVALMAGEPDIDCVGDLAATDGLLDILRSTRIDVVILDYALSDANGLATCFAIKQERAAPAVVLYSAYVDPAFAVPAAIAQADATVSKTAPVDELLSVVQHAAAGRVSPPRLDPELVQAASARLLIEDLQVAGLLMGATPVSEIGLILGLSMSDVRARALRIIGRLQADYRVKRETHHESRVAFGTLI